MRALEYFLPEMQRLIAAIRFSVKEIANGKTSALEVLARDLHSLKSLAGMGVPARFEKELHDWEAYLAKPGQDFKGLLSILERLEVEQTVGAEDAPKSVNAISYPCLVVDEPCLKVERAMLYTPEELSQIKVFRILLEPDEAMPRMRSLLIYRTIDDKACLLSGQAWFCKTGGQWIEFDPSAQEAELGTGLVYLRCLVLDIEGSLANLQLTGILDTSISSFSVKLESTLLGSKQAHISPPANTSMAENTKAWLEYGTFLASRLGYSLNTVAIIEIPSVSMQEAESLGRFVVQALRNTVKHGIEALSERQKLGKPDAAVFLVQHYKNVGVRQLRCTDDGRGLPGDDWDILAHGSSSDSIIDEFGGRGLGMGIMRVQAEGVLRGNLAWQSKPKASCTLLCTYPDNLEAESIDIFSLGTMIVAVRTKNLFACIEVSKRQLIQENDGYHCFTFLGKRYTVREIPALPDTQVPRLDTLWPAEKLLLACLGKEEVNDILALSAYRGRETVLLDPHSDTVYLPSLDTWITLVDD